eukprot:GHVL01036307.1.p1 GENE.GHVL01036307.1~~GHVL01036307.1.p1  ORF type:complete len:194 (+),score=43.62 GHVL01036307.1:20-601(+)
MHRSSFFIASCQRKCAGFAHNVVYGGGCAIHQDIDYTTADDDLRHKVTMMENDNFYTRAATYKTDEEIYLNFFKKIENVKKTEEKINFKKIENVNEKEEKINFKKIENVNEKEEKINFKKIENVNEKEEKNDKIDMLIHRKMEDINRAVDTPVLEKIWETRCLTNPIESIVSNILKFILLQTQPIFNCLVILI